MEDSKAGSWETNPKANKNHLCGKWLIITGMVIIANIH